MTLEILDTDIGLADAHAGRPHPADIPLGVPAGHRPVEQGEHKHALLPVLVDAMLGRWCRGLSACATVSLVLFGTRWVGAQELGPTLLSYRAPEGCPEVADFQRSVQRRSAHVRFVDEGSHDRELSIVLRRDGDYTNGELRIIERDGSLRQRSVRFTTCSEAVEGLALITLVSLDPQALTQTDKPAEPPPVQTPATKPPATPPKPQPKREPIPRAREAGMRVALGGELQAGVRALPASALGGALFVDFASSSQSWFTPLFRVGLSHVERRGLSDVGSGDARANFALTMATVSACPLRLSGGALTLRPCAFLGGGVLKAWGSGSDAMNLQQRTRPFAAWGGSALVFLRASQTVELVGDIALGATVLADTFGFENDRVWKTPALYLSSGVGVRFVFP